MQKLEELGCDPIAGMAHIALDQSNPVEVRCRMFSELAQYVAPKRKAIEISDDEGKPAQQNLEIAVKLVKPSLVEQFEQKSRLATCARSSPQ